MVLLLLSFILQTTHKNSFYQNASATMGNINQFTIDEQKKLKGIEFELQTNGPIYQMVKNLSKENPKRNLLYQKLREICSICND